MGLPPGAFYTDTFSSPTNQPSTFDPGNVLTPPDAITYSSSPLSGGGINLIGSTIDNPNASNNSGMDIASIISSISNTVLGSIAVSRIPSAQLTKTPIGQTAGLSATQQRSLVAQQQSSTTMLLILAVAVIVIVLLMKK